MQMVLRISFQLKCVECGHTHVYGKDQSGEGVTSKQITIEKENDFKRNDLT